MKKRIMTLLLALALLLTMAAPAFAEEPVYTTKETFVEAIRRHMIARETKFDLRFQPVGMSEAEFQSFLNQLWDLPLQHDESCPQGGDYLRWHLQSVGCSTITSLPTEVGADPVYTFPFRMVYHTTAAQEVTVNDEIRKIVAENHLTSPRMSDYDKVCIIYDWLCDNVSYDNENLDDEDYKLKYTAYAAAIDRKAVCQGYASLFYRLALESGVNARVVTGQSYDNSEGKWVGHAWNIVYLVGRAYLLDATWDAKRESYSYFLKPISAFQANHLVNITQDGLQPAYDYTALGVADADLQKNRGDVNGDSAATTADSVLADMQCLYEYLATGTVSGAYEGNETAFCTAADVNYSGTVDMLDYQYLYNLYQSMLSPT